MAGLFIKAWIGALVASVLLVLFAAADNPYKDYRFVEQSQAMSEAQLKAKAEQLIQDFRIGAWINVSWDVLVVRQFGLPFVGLFFIALTAAAVWGARHGGVEVIIYGDAEHWDQAGFHKRADDMRVAQVSQRLTGSHQSPREPRSPRSPGQ